MSASSYKPLSRKMLCPACGSEQVFKNTADDPTHWKCQGSGCSVFCIQDARGIDEPIFEGVPEPDWLEEELPQLELEDLPEPEPEDLLEQELPQPSWRELHKPESTLVEQAPAALVPVNVVAALDLSLPLERRTETFMGLLTYAASLHLERDEESNAGAYSDPDFRRQEISRRTLKGITDLRQIANTLELRWAMENENETWVDADGAEVTLQEVIESQMPDEERRASSGRARQIWSFRENSVPAFREAGIPDQRIAECSKSGLSSVLGIVSSAQHKIAEQAPPEDLPERYDRLIQAASETTTLQGLKKQIKSILDPDYDPPPSIPYSAESDGADAWWLVMKPTHEQFTEVVLGKLGDTLALDKQLPEYFYRYWGEFIVPPGQGEE